MKADGCDIVESLKETVKMEWSGDVHLNNKKVAKLHTEYKTRLSFIQDTGRSQQRASQVIVTDLGKVESDLEGYLSFLLSGKGLYTKTSGSIG